MQHALAAIARRCCVLKTGTLEVIYRMVDVSLARGEAVRQRTCVFTTSYAEAAGLSSGALAPSRFN